MIENKTRRIMVWVTTPRPNLSPRIKKKKKMFFFFIKKKKKYWIMLLMLILCSFSIPEVWFFFFLRMTTFQGRVKILCKNHVYAGWNNKKKKLLSSCLIRSMQSKIYIYKKYMSSKAEDSIFTFFRFFIFFLNKQFNIQAKNTQKNRFINNLIKLN